MTRSMPIMTSIATRIFVVLALLGGGLAIAVPLAAQAPPPPAPPPTAAEVEAALRRYAHEPSVEALVGVALREARADPERARRLARRSRMAGWLPTLRLSARRGRARDESASQSGSGDRTNLSADEDLTLEASLGFRLDRLVYGEDEVAWSREERALASLRVEVARSVVGLYFERRRLQLERDLLGLADIERSIRLAEIEAMLEAFTGGAFRGRGGGGAPVGGHDDRR